MLELLRNTSVLFLKSSVFCNLFSSTATLSLIPYRTLRAVRNNYGLQRLYKKTTYFKLVKASNGNACLKPGGKIYSRSEIASFNLKKKKKINVREALIAVKMAVKFKQEKNSEKAKKLFQHAMVLSPNHCNVLLNYGEFLESNKDFINADHLYLKALMVKPRNARALVNRERTLPVVNKMDFEELMRIEKKRDLFISLDKNDEGFKRMKKEMYLQLIYHSVGIDGNTMSLESIRAFVETYYAIDKSILEYNRILGLEAGLKYVNNIASNNYITVADILALHRRVMGYIHPISAGFFRKRRGFVDKHRPPAISEVELLMEKFLQQLQSFHATNMHPIHIAAFAHHKLVFIHPFAYGNVQTARLLMNLIFIRYGYPPVIIRELYSSQYFKYLHLANDKNGDVRPFYRFIARATECSIDVFLIG